MSDFKFRLQRLLEIRQREEERLMERQIRLDMALQEERNVLAQFEQQRHEYHGDIDRLKNDRVAVHELLHLSRFAADLDQRIDRQRERVCQAEQCCCEARAELTQARLEVRALEKLREKKHAAWTLEERRQEARVMDEIGSIATARRTMMAHG